MPISVVCRCGKRFNVKDEKAGQNVRCQLCNSFIPVPVPCSQDEPRVPVEAQPHPAMENTVSNDTITCRFCSEEIPANFRVCPFCKEPVNNTLSQEDYGSLLCGFVQELDSMTSSPGNLEMDRKYLKKLFTAKTIVLASISMLTILMMVFGVIARDMAPLMFSGVIFFLAFGISLLLSFMNDIKS